MTPAASCAASLLSTIHASVDEFLSALYPARCRLCGAGCDDGIACEDHALPLAPKGPRCPLCAAALPPALATSDRCADCRREPTGFGRVLALGDWRDDHGLRAWVMAFKHGGRRELAAPLGEALAAAWLRDLEREGESHSAREAVLVPVPLHLWRRVERGFDQAALLARAAARTSGATDLRALARVRATAVQGGPGARSRNANVHAAFAPALRWRWQVGWATWLRDALIGRALEGRDVWLVDDVVTSGATAKACASVLRKLGAKPRGVLALARAGRGAPAPRP